MIRTTLDMSWVRNSKTSTPQPTIVNTILYMHTTPHNSGGDTLFASMYAALSNRMKNYLEGLTALHDGVRLFGDGTPRSEHRVIIWRPESGKTSLFINGSLVRWLNGLPRVEGKGIAKILIEHCRSPEFFYRFRWQPHSIAFWDNRCCHHYAIDDYLPHTRSGYRVRIQGHSAPTPV